MEALYGLVKNWIEESPNNYVNISSKTKYGHEHLLKGVADKLGKKVSHMNFETLFQDVVGQLSRLLNFNIFQRFYLFIFF